MSVVHVKDNNVTSIKKVKIKKKNNFIKIVAVELPKKGKVKIIGCYSEKTSNTYDAFVLFDYIGDKYVNLITKHTKKTKKVEYILFVFSKYLIYNCNMM